MWGFDSLLLNMIKFLKKVWNMLKLTEEHSEAVNNILLGEMYDK